jgi:hypothetical protein
MGSRCFDLVQTTRIVWTGLCSRDERRTTRHKKAGAPNPFIDPGELDRHVAEMAKDFEEALQNAGTAAMTPIAKIERCPERK